MRASWGRAAAAVWCALAATAIAGCGGEGEDRVFGGPSGSAASSPSAAPPSAVARDAEPLRFLPVEATAQGACPSRTALGASPDAYATYRDAAADTCYVVTPASGMTARPAWAKAGYEATSGAGWVVTVGLTGRDRARFARLTGTLAAQAPPRNQLAMVRDGTLLSAPSVAQALTGGTVQISGNFTADSARKLARDIRGG
ncbi:SecDF P1 head subdomain-containing protein [Streptomyces sp. BRA346]|uniref:SecDF P1 head subdomain-containing protein n=1 Tax=Streptomyces sp. BRA346 TaxID=2878199 RepID=UPI0040634917